MGSATRDWQSWIDRGGTFTGVVAKRPDASIPAEIFAITDQIHMQPGDCFIIETPGGDGFGRSSVPKAAE